MKHVMRLSGLVLALALTPAFSHAQLLGGSVGGGGNVGGAISNAAGQAGGTFGASGDVTGSVDARGAGDLYGETRDNVGRDAYRVGRQARDTADGSVQADVGARSHGRANRYRGHSSADAGTDAHASVGVDSDAAANAYGNVRDDARAVAGQVRGTVRNATPNASVSGSASVQGQASASGH